MTEPYQLLVHSGLIVDGSGNPGFHAAVGVRGDRVYVLRGDVSQVPADRRIDATGRIVAPGFIDAHSHSDLVLLTDPTLEMKVRQGVTTEILGVDGLSYAPFDDPADLLRFVRFNAGIAGHPETDYSWKSVADLLARYDRSTSVNVGVFVGNTAPRINALGWSAAPADAVALDRMRGMVRDAMREGALGLSTGLDYPPGSYADTDELVALAKEAARFGGIYHTHVRYGLGDTYLDPFREALDIGRRAGLPVQLTHFSRSSRAAYSGGAQRMLDLVEDARADGLDVTFDTYPYEWGGTRLVRLLPAWLQADGPDRLQERLADLSLRDRLRSEVEQSAAVRQYAASRPFADVRLGNLNAPEHRQFEGWYLADVVVEVGRDLTETLCELAGVNPGATFTRPSPHAMTLWKFVCHPLGMIASDALLIGAYPSPRAYGCFARVLGDFVREERLLSLPEAIRKMTSFPAHRHGLTDRGLLLDGMMADLVVFDPATVHAPASYERPREFAQGISHVVVNGKLVLDGGVLTGMTPGRALRGAGSSH
ncbi:N-acyl-D-amino-acid deacylase family protein [Streptomyces sp. NPDC004752]